MADEEKKVEKTPEGEPKQEPVAAIEQPEEEVFDKERAMATIKNLRQYEKDAKRLQKLVEKYEQAETERKDAELTELERLQKQLADAQAKSRRLELENLKRSVAAEVGIPETLATRLQGDDAESLLADAKALKEALPATEKPKPKVAATRIDGQSEQKETEAQQRARLYRRGGTVFDPAAAAQRGGGVIAPAEQ